MLSAVRTSLRLSASRKMITSSKHTTFVLVPPCLAAFATTTVRISDLNSAKLAEISHFRVRLAVDMVASYESTVVPPLKRRKRPLKRRKTPIYGRPFVIRVQHSRASSRVSFPEHPFNPHHGGNGRRRCHNDHRNKTSAFTLIMTQTLYTNAATAAAAARRAR